MVHGTPSRQKARELSKKAHSLSREGHILASIKGMGPEAEARLDKAQDLMEQAQELQKMARLEDISVRQVDYWKKTKKGDRNYPRWVCSWQEGDKVITKYLGICAKIGRADALQKAKRLKAESLGLASRAFS